MTLRFDGKVAIVTGGGRGLGRAYALAFGARGASVVVNDIGGNGAWADSVVEEIRAGGGRATASHDSVSTPSGGAKVTELAIDMFSTVDIVVNNAGILRSALFEDMSLEQLTEVVHVHLLGAFHVTQPAWRVMKAKRYGRVVMTSSGSMFGMQANSNYVACKAGLDGLARALAAEGADHGIKANTIIPYAMSNISVDNPLIGADALEFRPMLGSLTSRRTPESVAAMVLYLCSEECQVNGEAYSVLAGRYARAFPAVTHGWISDEINPTVEDIAAHLPEIREQRGVFNPTSMVAEIRDVIQRLDEIQ